MSALTIEERRVGNVTILDMDGKVTIDGSNIQFRGAIRRLLAEGREQILLNLAQVSYIDSSGLGELVASHFSLSKKGGQIKLLQLTQSLRELMTITKLLTVFEVYDSEAEALDSFQTPAAALTEKQPLLIKEAHHEAHS